jgi:hypothetical protein
MNAAEKMTRPVRDGIRWLFADRTPRNTNVIQPVEPIIPIWPTENPPKEPRQPEPQEPAESPPKPMEPDRFIPSEPDPPPVTYPDPRRKHNQVPQEGSIAA